MANYNGELTLSVLGRPINGWRGPPDLWAKGQFLMLILMVYIYSLPINWPQAIRVSQFKKKLKKVTLAIQLSRYTFYSGLIMRISVEDFHLLLPVKLIPPVRNNFFQLGGVETIVKSGILQRWREPCVIKTFMEVLEKTIRTYSLILQLTHRQKIKKNHNLLINFFSLCPSSTSHPTFVCASAAADAQWVRLEWRFRTPWRLYK